MDRPAHPLLVKTVVAHAVRWYVIYDESWVRGAATVAPRLRWAHGMHADPSVTSDQCQQAHPIVRRTAIRSPCS